MKKRDREQLRASIAKDLVQGQGAHSPTKELLRQYTPLEGVITPAPDVSRRPGNAQPVETPWHHVPPWHRNTIHHGTVPPWRQPPPSHPVPPWNDMPRSREERAAGTQYDQLQAL